MNVDYAFILAAGFGTRLRPYTHDRPKPMVEVGGQSMIMRSMDALRAVGVKEIVVNMHYLADVLRAHLEEYQAQHKGVVIHMIYEDEILDTGGGVKNALSYFKGQPFYVLAGDNIWTDGAIPALERLRNAWNPEKMDIITLMQPVDKMVLTQGVGDYHMREGGHVHRALDKSGTHMWTNIRLNAAHIYEGIDEPIFSMMKIMDDCEKKGRLYAIEHDGEWHHISTPEDLKRVDENLRG